MSDNLIQILCSFCAVTCFVGMTYASHQDHLEKMRKVSEIQVKLKQLEALDSALREEAKEDVAICKKAIVDCGGDPSQVVQMPWRAWRGQWD